MGQPVRCIVVLLLALSVTNTLATRIIGGEEVEPYSIKYQASLQYQKRHYCGATLITSQWLVSAAHCKIPIYWMRVVLSEHNLNENNGLEQVFTVSKIVTHEFFYRWTLRNDIMLIKLSRPAQLNGNVQPAQLPDRNIPGPPTFTTCTVSGWGVTHLGTHAMSPSLRSVDVQIIPRCRLYYGWLVNDNMLCAGTRSGGKDSCQGDSGGPLMCNGKFEGIVSWGRSCATYYPGVYTKVRKYIQWMRWTMYKNT